MLGRLSILLYVALALAALDLAAAGVLAAADRAGRLGGLVAYFEYGRSVPGKLDRWVERPGAPGNLFDAGWRGPAVVASAASHADERADEPVVRVYGMSFVNRLVRAAAEIRPDLTVDLHSGPSAPPNYTHALFLDDRANRDPGDVAVLGILSSAVPALAAMSNRTWLFEQPAPFTYPVFLPDGADGLARVEPSVDDPGAERALRADPQARAAWEARLRERDAFASPILSGAQWLDASPFARLVRRSLALGHVARVEAAVLDGAYPWATVLRRMVVEFADVARADGQVPVVVLVQTRGPAPPDLKATLGPVLEARAIPYLATVDHADPGDPTAFLGDGHYRRDVDATFGAAFLDLVGDAMPAPDEG